MFGLGGANEDAGVTEKVSVPAVQIMGHNKVGKAEESMDPVAVLLPYIEQAVATGSICSFFRNTI